MAVDDLDRNDKEETRGLAPARQRVPAMQHDKTLRRIDRRRFAPDAHLFDADDIETTPPLIDPLDDRDGRCLGRAVTRSAP